MSLVTISNDVFTATVDTVGAQLTSLKRNATDDEFIWQRAPEHWAESAPVCFPVVGNLNKGGFRHEDKWYAIAKHGCVRSKPFFKARHTAKSLALSIVSDIETKKSYPFSFKLTVSFTLDSNGLIVKYFAENLDEVPMPMSLGYHPAFALDAGASLSEYDIIFSEKENRDLYGITKDGFGLKAKKYLKDVDCIALSDCLFDEDALVFKNIQSQRISIIRRNSDWHLDMETGGAPHLALWSKPGAPFVCIEPWYICPDEKDAPEELSKKPGITILAPRDSFTSSYKILP